MKENRSIESCSCRVIKFRTSFGFILFIKLQTVFIYENYKLSVTLKIDKMKNIYKKLNFNKKYKIIRKSRFLQTDILSKSSFDLSFWPFINTNMFILHSEKLKAF